MRGVLDWLRGEWNLLRWRTRGLLMSRKRVTFIVVILIVGLAGTLIWRQGQNFRAGDDAAEGTTFDYIEHVTTEGFQQELVAIPEAELSTKESYALLLDLVGAGYFRLLTAEDRQMFLQSWQTDPEWKRIVTEIESQEGGVWAWLEWLEPYCEEDGGDRFGFLGVDAARAQISALCANAALSEKKPIDQPKNWLSIQGIEEYARTWQAFINGVYDRCGNNPSYSEHKKEIIYYKSCWTPVHLNILYQQVWTDIKHRQSRVAFDRLERDRIASAVKVWLSWKDRNEGEISAPMRQAYARAALEVGLVLTPIGVENIIFKAGSAAIGKLAATRVARPVVVGFVIQQSRIGTQIATVVTPILQKEVRINLTAMFSKARIMSSSTKARVLGKLGREWVEDVLRQATRGAEEILTKTTIRGTTRSQMESTLYEVLAKVEVTDSRTMAAIRRQFGAQTRALDHTTFGLAVKETGDTIMNEDALVLRGLKKNLSHTQISDMIRYTWTHEFHHHIVKNSFTRFGASKKLRYNPLEEAFIELQTRRLVPGVDVTDIYPDEVLIAKKYRDMLIRKYMKEQRFDPVRAGIEADTKVEKLLFDTVERGPGMEGALYRTEFERLLESGLPRNHEIFLLREPNGVINWITKQVEEDRFNAIYRLIDEAYK